MDTDSSAWDMQILYKSAHTHTHICIYVYIVVGRVLAARVVIRKEMHFSRTIRALCACYRRSCCQSTVSLPIAPSAPIQKCIEELVVIGWTVVFTLLYVYGEGGCRPDMEAATE